MSEWVSVKDRLPGESRGALVYSNAYHDCLCGVAVWDGDSWRGCGRVLYGVSHWMPLPDPPEPKPTTKEARSEMSHVKGYKGNAATQKAFESLGWVESQCRSITDTDDGGMWLCYDFDTVKFRVRIDPDGKIRASGIGPVDGASEKIQGREFYPPKGE